MDYRSIPTSGGCPMTHGIIKYSRIGQFSRFTGEKKVYSCLGLKYLGPDLRNSHSNNWLAHLWTKLLLSVKLLRVFSTKSKIWCVKDKNAQDDILERVNSQHPNSKQLRHTRSISRDTHRQQTQIQLPVSVRTCRGARFQLFIIRKWLRQRLKFQRYSWNGCKCRTQCMWITPPGKSWLSAWFVQFLFRQCSRLYKCDYFHKGRS